MDDSPRGQRSEGEKLQGPGAGEIEQIQVVRIVMSLELLLVLGVNVSSLWCSKDDSKSITQF